jgi:peptide/nickel transport system substrate-binding protein
MNRRTPLALSLAALSILTLACGAPQPPAARSGPATEPAARAAPKRVTAAVLGDPVALNYAISSAGAFTAPGSEALEELVNAGLSTMDTTGSLVPRIAEAVPSTDNGLWKISPDGRMETTWRIKPNVQWHDGTPFTSADLLFTAGVIQDREVGVFRNRAYDAIEGVEAPDASTLTVRWRRPYIAADTLFSPNLTLPLPKHLLEAAYANEKANFADQAYFSTEFVGTGPFKLRSWERGSHLLVDANDRYVLGRPKIDEVEVRFILDSNTLVANVLAGAADFMMGRGLSVEEALGVRTRWAEGRIEAGPYTWIQIWPQLLNPTPAVTLDPAFRRALTHATDRQQLVDSLQGGLTSVAHSLLNPNEPEYNDVEPRIVRYEFDPRRGAQMIEQLGYTRGGDGFMVDGTNRRLTVQIKGNAGDELRRKIVFAVADQWQQVGVEVEPLILPQQRLSDFEYVATFPGWWVTQRPNQLLRLSDLHSAQAPLPSNGFTGANISRYMNPEFDALIDRYFATIPRQERTQIVGQIIHHMTDQALIMGLFYTIEPILVSNRVSGVMARHSRSTHAWNAHLWDVTS